MTYAFVYHSMLADKLNMAPEEAERWIVNLIRNARLDAKIDSKLVREILRLDHPSLAIACKHKPVLGCDL
jgi:PCI domain